MGSMRQNLLLNGVQEENISVPQLWRKLLIVVACVVCNFLTTSFCFERKKNNREDKLVFHNGKNLSIIFASKHVRIFIAVGAYEISKIDIYMVRSSSINCRFTVYVVNGHVQVRLQEQWDGVTRDSFTLVFWRSCGQIECRLTFCVRFSSKRSEFDC